MRRFTCACSAFRAVALAVCLMARLDAQSKDSRRDPEQIGNRDVGSGVNFYSLEKEVALGRQLAQEVERAARIVEDPAAAEFLNRLAQNIARNSDAKCPVTAKIIESPEVNAFALPGGFLFVNSGLIGLAETEAELAGPVAHEIAHVAARHGTRQVSRAQIANLASIPLIFLGGWGGFAARQGAGLAVPLGFVKFSRAFEQEADRLALQYVYKSGYDPLGFIDFLERVSALDKKRPGALSDLLRSHPKIDARIRAAESDIQSILPERPQYVVSTSEFQDVRSRLVRLLDRRSEPAPSIPTLERKGGGEERPTLKRRENR